MAESALAPTPPPPVEVALPAESTEIASRADCGARDSDAGPSATVGANEAIPVEPVVPVPLELVEFEFPASADGLPELVAGEPGCPGAAGPEDVGEFAVAVRVAEGDGVGVGVAVVAPWPCAAGALARAAAGLALEP